MASRIRGGGGRGHLYNVDIARFFGILMIMGHHRYLIGYTGKYLFCNAWAWVDYFFILSGFFTARHFSNRNHSDGKTAVTYTVNKFKIFLPYSVFAVFFQYLFTFLSMGADEICTDSWNALTDMLYEMMFLSSSGIVHAQLAPVWYLSAVFLMLPVMICFMLRFDKYWTVCAWLIPILYYGRYGLNTVREWPMDLIRSFSVMTLGTFAYDAVNWMNRFFQKKRSFFLIIAATISEIGTWLLAVYITTRNIDVLNLLPLLFFINSVLMLSGETLTGRIKGRWIQFMGEMSVPMFLFHWVTGTILAMTTMSLSRIHLLYYTGTLLLSILSTGLMKRIKFVRRK